MKMFHQQDLIGIGPDDLREQIRHVNDEMNDALRTAVETTFGTIDPTTLAWAEAAVKAIPYGLIRNTSPGRYPSRTGSTTLCEPPVAASWR